MLYRIGVLLFALLLSFPGIGSAGSVGKDKARIVAQNWLAHCVSTYGSWDGVSSPTISDEETLMHENKVVGFNFLISPKGNILVTARDDMPPVKLYSDTSTLSIFAENTRDISAWIADEISQIGNAIDTHVSEPAIGAALLEQNNPDVKAWRIFSDANRFEREHSSYMATTESLSLGPLMTSTWAQADPYNSQCPMTSTECRTIVGCVATAASQIMKYWSHPKTGTGVISYEWYNGAVPVTLGRDFSSSNYDWANMPNSLDSTNTDAQKAAVAKLCADVGIAFQMDYGCNSSGASTLNTPVILKTYFKYMNTATWVSRSNYNTSSTWMQVFKNEVQYGRPSELRLKNSKGGGHAVVVDGYRDTPSETVHINMGWSGNYDGWYTPDSFVTGSDNWTDTFYQGAAIGIQPNTSPAPIIKANGLQGNVTVSNNESVLIDISLNAGGDTGKMADWWAILDTPSGPLSLVSTGWTSGIVAAGQFSLTDIPLTHIYNSILPEGNYTFYFGVDETPDGILDQPLFYNSVKVQVRKEESF
jgi:hypothetical protein